MDLYTEHLEHALASFIVLMRFVLEAIAAFVVFLGLVKTLQHAIKVHRLRGGHRPTLDYPLEFMEIRLSFGLWLALALEFQLAADILSTTIAPSFNSLGKLALIAVIRTFLNYFLGKEIETESRELKDLKHEQLEAEHFQ
ncbi:MAG: DUF1622 domain-containing protein [Synechococcus sp.]